VLRPDPPPSREVVVVTSPIEAGAAITASQVRVARQPVAWLPDGAVTDPTAVVGARAVIGLTRGTVVTTSMMFDAGRARRDGQVLVGLRLSDPGLTALVRVGDLVSVVSTDQTGAAVVLATKVRVAAITAPGGEGGALDVGASSQPLVFVETDRDTGARLTTAATRGEIGLMLG